MIEVMLSTGAIALVDDVDAWVTELAHGVRKQAAEQAFGAFANETIKSVTA